MKKFYRAGNLVSGSGKAMGCHAVRGSLRDLLASKQERKDKFMLRDAGALGIWGGVRPGSGKAREYGDGLGPGAVMLPGFFNST